MAITTAQRRMLLIGVIPLLLLVVGGALVTVATIRGKITFDYSATFAAGPQGVRIFSAVPTHVIGGASDQVRVSVDGTYAAQQPKVDVTTDQGVLDIRTVCPAAECEVELTVQVPAAAMVQAKADGASIDVSDLTAKVKIDADGGTATLSRMRSPQVSLDVRKGSSSMQFDEPPEQVTATVSDGSLSVRLPRTTTYNVDAVAAQGSTDITMDSDPAATHRLFLRTSYGSISVS
ncbi:hypothetical protein E1263_35140 [Kribbella antibiotica]|uniref:Uncharacterized protein n=1 Tax=Kribbella antibiotica TaxID=190195 RepID=A0A4R4YPT8_9ACTN|nr:DUF4097 family beta strand repeat-containing protein [Kribbella antibiotica]TDD47188.1 hypothetical protein E1263_35140 [Kribbella antibiotica]